MPSSAPRAALGSKQRSTDRRLIQQGGLLGERYRCIKLQYPAMAVPTGMMLVSPSRWPATVNADGVRLAVIEPG
jgi:hypothetical protein